MKRTADRVRRKVARQTPETRHLCVAPFECYEGASRTTFAQHESDSQCEVVLKTLSNMLH